MKSGVFNKDDLRSNIVKIMKSQHSKHKSVPDIEHPNNNKQSIVDSLKETQEKRRKRQKSWNDIDLNVRNFFSRMSKMKTPINIQQNNKNCDQNAINRTSPTIIEYNTKDNQKVQQIFQQNYFKILCEQSKSTYVNNESLEEQLKQSLIQEQKVRQKLKKETAKNKKLIEQVKMMNPQSELKTQQLNRYHSSHEVLEHPKNQYSQNYSQFYKSKYENLENNYKERLKSLQEIIESKNKDVELMCKAHQKELQIKNTAISKLNKKIQAMGDYSIYALNPQTENSIAQQTYSEVSFNETPSCKFFQFQLNEVLQLLNHGLRNKQVKALPSQDSRYNEQTTNPKQIFQQIELIKQGIMSLLQQKTSKIFKFPKPIQFINSNDPSIIEGNNTAYNLTESSDFSNSPVSKLTQMKAAIKNAQMEKDQLNQQHKVRMNKLKQKLKIVLTELNILSNELHMLKCQQNLINFHEFKKIILRWSTRQEQNDIQIERFQVILLFCQNIQKNQINEYDESLKQLQQENFQLLEKLRECDQKEKELKNQIQKERNMRIEEGQQQNDQIQQIQNHYDQVIQKLNSQIRKLDQNLQEEIYKNRNLEEISQKYEKENEQLKEENELISKKYEEDLENYLNQVKELINQKKDLENQLISLNQVKAEKMNKKQDDSSIFESNISIIQNDQVDELIGKSFSDVQNVNILLMETNEQLRQELMERENNENKLMKKVNKSHTLYHQIRQITDKANEERNHLKLAIMKHFEQLTNENHINLLCSILNFTDLERKLVSESLIKKSSGNIFNKMFK